MRVFERWNDAVHARVMRRETCGSPEAAVQHQYICIPLEVIVKIIVACFDICVRVFVCYARAVLLVRGTARGLPIEGKGCFVYECSVERG